jgi:hypothetical protein
MSDKVRTDNEQRILEDHEQGHSGFFDFLHDEGEQLAAQEGDDRRRAAELANGDDDEENKDDEE